MPRRAPKSVLEVAIAVGGYRKGFRVLTFIEQWTIAQNSLGHVPTLEEAAAWWKESERTWFHRQAEFREVFDLLENPGPIATAAIELAEQRAEEIRDGVVVGLLGRLSPTAAPAPA